MACDVGQDRKPGYFKPCARDRAAAHCGTAAMKDLIRKIGTFMNEQRAGIVNPIKASKDAFSVKLVLLGT